ncbi:MULTISPECIES: hypothetical protein [unclassified Streptomyces]|uniref:hypothetical protein n=1 Tax=Streptomyces TaxID=1883 RepID=UPI00136DA8D1|nr:MULTISPECIES: hypothetical protein [unclassified Streptomyces]NEA01320.1 hypothetical protein [Streptomyces sp. SID10116]MYY83945.1 hypothetical protein [Streptomyces sp. SID335]MYZ12123.1 hypothetical protein [Streptomyces sp. SID337]NDZ84147.1 hypothetical protein [Streptomyces sp. SID10115]NEB44644.1 hypothetical protein [Streptomyces sp. SID339]
METDASGWVILANLGDQAAGQPQLARIRDQGHAIGPTPLFGHDAVAAPLWPGRAGQGRTVAGSVTLLVRHAELHSDVVRARLAGPVMDTAARLSGYLTHLRPSSTTSSVR